MKLSKRHFLQSSVGLGVGLGLGLMVDEVGRTLVRGERLLMGFGTQLSIAAAHWDAKALERALDASVARLRHLESVMSLFLGDSQVSQLNRTGLLRSPNSDLLQILRLAQEVSQQSAGAFDVTVQPLWTLWRQASLEKRLPSAVELQRAQALVSWQALEVKDDVVRFKQPGMGLTLNGIAQGYACDQARAVLQQYGVRHALLDLGEWSAFGDSDWSAPKIGVGHPRAVNELLATVNLHSRQANIPKSLATSSDAQMSFSDDHLYHHIFDPHTGASPAMASSVSVVAESCALADALTKVFFMEASKGTGFDHWVDRSKALCRQWEVEVILADKAGSVWSNLLG